MTLKTQIYKYTEPSLTAISSIISPQHRVLSGNTRAFQGFLAGYCSPLVTGGSIRGVQLDVQF